MPALLLAVLGRHAHPEEGEGAGEAEVDADGEELPLRQPLEAPQPRGHEHDVAPVSKYVRKKGYTYSPQAASPASASAPTATGAAEGVQLRYCGVTHFTLLAPVDGLERDGERLAPQAEDDAEH